MRQSSSILRKSCLRLEVLEDRNAPSATMLDPATLAVPQTGVPQTREHILLARQIGVPAATGQN